MVKISTELQFLIESCKVSLMHFPSENYTCFIENSVIDWQKIIEIAEYHGVNPILFDAIQNNKIAIPIFENLIAHFRNNTVSNLISSHEFVRVAKLLEENLIDFLPYKGHLFLAKLYLGKQIREIGDIDVLVSSKDSKKALKILIEDGYGFHDVDTELNISSQKLIEIIPETFGMNETTLSKTINGKRSFVDFHWGFHYSFLPYKINLKALFDVKDTVEVNKVQCVSPSDQTIFIMLIIHHGGRDTWMKLKYLADLIAFMETKGDKINWEEMILKMEEMKLKRPMLVGFFLLQNYFAYDLPSVIQEQFEKENITVKLTEPIVGYWENCYNILSVKGRLKYEIILLSIQDKGFSRIKYFKELFKMYTIPNQIETKRLITFPDNYYFLNGISKVVTYLYKRSFRVIR